MIGTPVSGMGRRVAAAADWAVRHRPRVPVIRTGPEHPPWVGRALTDCLPLVPLSTVVVALRLLGREWAWLACALVYGAYVLVFVVLPWLVSIARHFVLGYRGG